MGHEYVELKNTAAAVDAYRHAVDINPKDYRAWHELNPSNSAPRGVYACSIRRAASAVTGTGSGRRTRSCR